MTLQERLAQIRARSEADKAAWIGKYKSREGRAIARRGWEACEEASAAPALLAARMLKTCSDEIECDFSELKQKENEK